MFRYLVLGLLRDGVAYHGYALMKEYRERSGVSISTGNFYRELQRLLLQRLVRTAPKVAGADSRRAPYEITGDGRLAFDRWLAGTPTNVGGYDDELSTRAVFLGRSEPTQAHALLDRWYEAIWIHGRCLERERERTPPLDGRNAASARSLLLARRMKHVLADLEFIEELRLSCFGARMAGGPQRRRERTRISANGRKARQVPRGRGGPPLPRRGNQAERR